MLRRARRALALWALAALGAVVASIVPTVASTSFGALAAPVFPGMQARVAAYVASEAALLTDPVRLNATAVRDLAAAAWALLNPPPGAPPLSPANASTAVEMLERVLAAQWRPSGIWPWTFDGKDLDNNSVQFVSLPLLLSIVHHAEVIGASTLRRWAPQLELAAAASFAEGATATDEAQPFYTNIYTMRFVNLFLFAQVTGNATVRTWADAALADWTALVDAAGVHEYLSPTYTAVALVNLYAGAAAIADAAVATTLRRYLGFMLAFSAASFFGPAQGMGGPHSRDYDFLSGAAGMDWAAALSGIAVAAGVEDMDANCLSQDPITNAHLFTLWGRGELPAAPAEVLALAKPPEGDAWRVTQSTYAPAAGALGPTNGSDFTLYQGATASLGTSSLYYCAQDRMVLAQLPLRLPQVSVVADRWDAPWGDVRSGDCGHDAGKPTHMKATIAAVQDRALALVLQDLSMALEPSSGCGAYSSVAINVIFPAALAGIDAVYTGAGAVRVANASSGAPDVPLPIADNTVAVRAGGGIVAFRIPFVDGLAGYAPRSVLRFDGPHGLARLAVYLYEGAPTTFAATPPPSRSITAIAVGSANLDAEAAAFVAAFAALVLSNEPANASDWRVSLAPPQGNGGGKWRPATASPLPPGFSSTLSASMFVPFRKLILSRRVNGSDVHVAAPGALEIAASDGTRRSFRAADFKMQEY